MRQSTNEKLESIINSKEEDDGIDESILEEELRAKAKLRKSTLYGVGARAKIPHVRHPPKYEMSPFSLPEPKGLPGAKTALNSQVPPGAHQDAYRIVQYATTKCRNDPDRVFYTTSKFTEGVVAVEQPPWYYGNNNKTVPSDDNFLTSAARYGFRGSKNIQERNIRPTDPPTHTRTERTPKHLKGNEIINEWVPPILATTFQTVNRLESPKLWPENTRYVTGFKKKMLPKSSVYRRETTVAIPRSQRPQTSESLQSLLEQSMTERRTLQDYSKMESMKTWQSPPVLAQNIFANSWSNKLNTSASETLKIVMNTVTPPFDPHTLVDHSDVMKYSGSTAFIVHSQSNEELKFRLTMEKNHNSLPYELRWRQVELAFRGMKAKLKKEMTMTMAITEAANRLRKEAILCGTPTSLRRSEFITCASKIPQLDGFSLKQLSLIYSSFDPYRKNVMRFVEFILSLAVLDQPKAPTITKICTLWQYYMNFGADMATFDIALAVLCACCSSDKQRQGMEELFKKVFRPCCYRNSVMERLDMIDHLGSEAADIFLRSSTPTLSGITKKKDLSSQPQFNICDEYLDQASFLRNLEKCPEILDSFEEMLTERLIHFYVDDPRVEKIIEKTEDVEA